ncbi:MAG: Transglycosylase domain protein [Frankiales bacterium]|nr:Transglycosylase domain protein [Frankiales bacterium]
MPLLRAQKPRHAKPSKAAPVLAAGGMTATIGAGLSIGSSASAATANDFARLRQCESGGNYSTNTGNGYYGAYQFDLRTWHGLGYSGQPSSASAGTQDQAAETLQAQRGWQPWPACSRKLGLGRGGNGDDRASRGGRHLAPKVTSTTFRKAAATPTTPPAFAATLTTAMVKTPRADVRAWQARMVSRGWDLAVDGRYGPRTAKVAARFAAEKHLKTEAGTVNKAVWAAAWQLPVG